MNNPFTAKLRAQVAALQTDLAAARAELDDAARQRDEYKTRFDGVEPDIEARAQARSIDLIASTGTLGPIATADGKHASSEAPRTKVEFLDRYGKLEGEEAGAYFDKFSHLLDT